MIGFLMDLLFKIKNFIPQEYHKSIYEIDYAKLYESGKRIILTDLDNTLVSYHEETPTEENMEWKKKLIDMGFEIVIVSNSNAKRVKKYSEAIDLDYQHRAYKPLKIGFKKGLKKALKAYKPEEVVMLGDQLLTDVFGANRMKFYVCFIEAVSIRTDRFTTRFNRHFEKKVVKRIKKKYPEKYEEVFIDYE